MVDVGNVTVPVLKIVRRTKGPEAKIEDQPLPGKITYEQSKSFAKSNIKKWFEQGERISRRSKMPSNGTRLHLEGRLIIWHYRAKRGRQKQHHSEIFGVSQPYGITDSNEHERALAVKNEQLTNVTNIRDP
ncbi:MAG TPA: hypothetical protein VFK44_05930 [Bacillales bacterium]|nr:hypothetical protein [Bacillales bacterium]